MEKSGRQVLFDEDDHRPQSIPVAIDIAAVSATIDRAIQEASTYDLMADALVGDPTRATQAQRQTFITRASELTGFAHNLTRLCAPELADQLSRELQPPKE